MNRPQIANIISKRPTETMQTVRVYSRPPEKTNYYLVTMVGGHRWYCERPKYFWQTLDKSLFERAYYDEQKFLFPHIKEPMAVFDRRGLFWAREEISSIGLIPYFLKNPTKYLWWMSDHTARVERIMEKLKEIEPTLTKEKYFAKNLKTFKELYYELYLAQSTIFMVVDELVWRFRQFLLTHLPKELVNVYFPHFLAGEATKLALSTGHVKERGALEYSTTRGVLYAMNMTPRAFYAQPRFFTEYPHDKEVLNKLTKTLKPAQLEEFIAYRWIVPASIQISEESQYAETSGMSAHFGRLMRAIAKKLKIPVENTQKMTVEQLIKKLQ